MSDDVEYGHEPHGFLLHRASEAAVRLHDEGIDVITSGLVAERMLLTPDELLLVVRDACEAAAVVILSVPDE